MSTKKMICDLGIFDIPIIQSQPNFKVDLLDANVILFGAPMSGKTTFLKNLIHILHKQYDERTEQVFILDFGSGLAEYAGLPLVSAYFDNSNEEYVKRVFKIMDNTLKENIRQLNGRNYRDAGASIRHTTFIIDNLNAFMDESRYIAYQEKLSQLIREGLSGGITVVVTALDTKGVARFLGAFKQKIALDMPEDKYVEIFGGKTKGCGNNPGRGFANVTIKPDGITGTFRMGLPYEVQLAVPFIQEQSDMDGETWNLFQERLKQKFGIRTVKKYRTFPKELTKEEYRELTKGQTDAAENTQMTAVGLDYVNFRPVCVDVWNTPVIAIYGKKDFGKTNLLSLIVDDFVEKSPDSRIVLFDDGRHQLRDIYERIHTKIDTVLIDGYKVEKLVRKDGTEIRKKLSTVQQLYVYLNENYISLDKKLMCEIYGLNKDLSREVAIVPEFEGEKTPFTLFVLQSKQIYMNVAENKKFFNLVLPQMQSVADENGYCFLFSDVQKMSEADQNTFFNTAVSQVFLLDNIGEFAGERGQKTIFGNMDVKMLKEDYAKCEKGDGYCYDVEADDLKKLKFIKR